MEQAPELIRNLGAAPLLTGGISQWSLRMRRSPSIVPHVADRDVYLVLDDFGKRGRSWRETDEERTDRTTVLRT